MKRKKFTENSKKFSRKSKNILGKIEKKFSGKSKKILGKIEKKILG